MIAELEAQLPPWFPGAEDEAAMRWLGRAVVGALLAGLLGFVVAGADGPADPTFGRPEPPTTTTTVAPATTAPPG